jgi:GT2 family glycosyltransferase
MDTKKINTPETNDCTVVILSFNTKDVTDECLRKTKQAAAYAQRELNNKTEIIVVDNGSIDDSVEMIQRKHPDVTLIALKKNVGYSCGNNLALKKASTPFILLLNSDTYIRENTLVQSISYMAKHPACDILSARLVYPDNSFQAHSGFLPTPFRTIRWAFLIESIPVIKNFIQPIYQYNPEFYKTERTLDWASTGFFFIRKSVYDRTGGFDERIFLYMEDVEWCQRIKNNELRIQYSPTIDVVHLGGFSSKKFPSATLLRRHIEGMAHFHSVHYPKTVHAVMGCVMTGMFLRAVFYSLTVQPTKASPYWEVIRSK